jgi:hypothetical protein
MVAGLSQSAFGEVTVSFTSFAVPRPHSSFNEITGDDNASSLAVASGQDQRTAISSSNDTVRALEDSGCSQQGVSEVWCVSPDYVFELAGGDDRINVSGACCGIIHLGDGSDVARVASKWSVEGGAGHDKLFGGAGHQFFRGSGDGDLMVGGSGHDGVAYIDRPTGVRVDLSSGKGDDTLRGIEDVYGTDHSDVLIGSSRANTLESGSGADHIRGGAGPDQTRIGSGDDALTGPGADVVSGSEMVAGRLDCGAGRDRLTIPRVLVQAKSCESVAVHFSSAWLHTRTLWSARPRLGVRCARICDLHVLITADHRRALEIDTRLTNGRDLREFVVRSGTVRRSLRHKVPMQIRAKVKLLPVGVRGAEGGNGRWSLVP